MADTPKVTATMYRVDWEHLPSGGGVVRRCLTAEVYPGATDTVVDIGGLAVTPEGPRLSLDHDDIGPLIKLLEAVQAELARRTMTPYIGFPRPPGSTLRDLVDRPRPPGTIGDPPGTVSGGGVIYDPSTDTMIGRDLETPGDDPRPGWR